jgi:hypothetical protein
VFPSRLKGALFFGAKNESFNASTSKVRQKLYNKKANRLIYKQLAI